MNKFNKLNIKIAHGDRDLRHNLHQQVHILVEDTSKYTLYDKCEVKGSHRHYIETTYRNEIREHFMEMMLFVEC